MKSKYMGEKHFWNGGIRTFENIFLQKNYENITENGQNQLFFFLALWKLIKGL